MNSVSPCYGLFILPDKDSVTDWDSKSDGYIILFRKCSHFTDSDPNPDTDHYCTHFWDRYPFSNRDPSPCPAKKMSHQGNIIYLTKNDKIFPMIPTGINPPKYDLSKACPLNVFRIFKIKVIRDHQEILIQPGLAYFQADI